MRAARITSTCGVRAAPPESSSTWTTLPRGLFAAEKYDGSEPVNLGTGREITIRELVDLIAKLTGFVGEVLWDPSQPDGQPRRALDTSRACERFGFVAQMPWEQGLRATIDWYESRRGAGS